MLKKHRAFCVFRSVRAFSLVELMMVLVLCSTLAGLMFVLYNKYQQKQRLHTFQSDLIMMLDGIRTWRAGEKDYSAIPANKELSLRETIFCTPSNVFPDQKICGDNFKNPWGGAYTLYRQGDVYHFDLVIYGITSVSDTNQACNILEQFGGDVGGTSRYYCTTNKIEASFRDIFFPVPKPAS
jgi:type II secretory pathway pseudopilin PulG